VAQRKKRPVLYEVVNRSRRSRGRTAAWRSTETSTTSQPAPEKAATPRPSPPTCATPPVAESPGEPLLRVANDRLYVVLSWPYVAVAAAVVVAIVAGSFYAGRRSAMPVEPNAPTGDQLFEESELVPAEVAEAELAPTHRPREIEVATPVEQPRDRAQPVEQPRERRPSPRPEPEPEPEFVFQPDHHYVLVQYFPTRRRDHAEAAAEFLRTNGIDCVIQQAPRDLRLYAAQPCATLQAARRLQQRIVDLGEEYARQGGGYDFAGSEPHKF
jgi:hypothetical protein